MTVCHYCRYWGEAKSGSGVTLQQLHELAFRRAEESRRAGQKSKKVEESGKRQRKTVTGFCVYCAIPPHFQIYIYNRTVG